MLLFLCFHPLFSYCCFPEVTFLQPACEGAAAPFLSQETRPHLQREQPATAVSGQCPEMLTSVEHLRDLTMFWFVFPFLARFHKHFRRDGWVLVMQLDLPSCALQASQTISQVHMILLLFCAACECRVDGFGATLLASSSLESPLQDPQVSKKSQGHGTFPFFVSGQVKCCVRVFQCSFPLFSWMQKPPVENCGGE